MGLGKSYMIFVLFSADIVFGVILLHLTVWLVIWIKIAPIYHLMMKLLDMSTYMLNNLIIFIKPWQIAPHLWSGPVSHCSTLQNCFIWQISFCDFCCFGAISVLSWFTHFCVEQKWNQHSCLWSKNDKFNIGDNLHLFLESCSDHRL